MPVEPSDLFDCAKRLGQILSERQLRIGVVETTTGGLISAAIIGVPGSSKYFECGLVVYGRKSKIDILGLNADTLDSYGAVSTEVAMAMAETVRRISNADIGLAETGIAGPIAGRSPKPIGTCYIAIASGDTVHSEETTFTGSRDDIRLAIVQRAITMTIEMIRS